MFRVVGLIRELQPKASIELPSVVDIRGKLDPDLVAPIVKHLKEGVITADALDICVDPIDPSVRIPGGSGLQCDGVWVWRQDLCHYVERYQIDLDRDFVTHVLEGHPIEFSPERAVETMRAFSAAQKKGD